MSALLPSLATTYRVRPTASPTAPSSLSSLLVRLVAVLLKLLIAKLSAIVGLLEWGRLRYLDYEPRSDDIFIVTYPRSGTTWMQMILYQLATDGDMAIPHIAQRCPWFERSLKAGKGFETLPSPRIFKSHLDYRHIPKGPCKYIYVSRDGKDVAVSYYHLYRSHNGFKGTFAEFFDRFLKGNVEFGSWFRHVEGWRRHRNDPNVLFLRYEDLLADLEGSLRTIIAFCGFEISPERLPTILERCSFAFMKRHESQFDHLTGTLWEQGLQLNAFLRKGRTGEGNDCLTPQQVARFEGVYDKLLQGIAPESSTQRKEVGLAQIGRCGLSAKQVPHGPILLKLPSPPTEAERVEWESSIAPTLRPQAGSLSSMLCPGPRSNWENNDATSPVATSPNTSLAAPLGLSRRDAAPTPKAGETPMGAGTVGGPLPLVGGLSHN